jgi:hypothetical protein
MMRQNLRKHCAEHFTEEMEAIIEEVIKHYFSLGY